MNKDDELRKLFSAFNVKRFSYQHFNKVFKENSWIKEYYYPKYENVKQYYTSFNQYLISIIKDVKLRKCENCGNFLTYGASTGTGKFCSKKCALSGNNNPFSKHKDKVKESYIKKYGVDNPAKSKEVQNKIKETLLKNYGVINTFQLDKTKEKIKNTFQERYGVDHNSQNEEIKEKMIKSKLSGAYNRIKKTYAGKYEPMFSEEEYIGVHEYYYWKCCKCGNIFKSMYNNGRIISRCFKCEPRKQIIKSQEEIELTEYCKQFYSNILENDKTLIYPLELDIVIPEKKIAIEFNGIYWHKNKKGYHNMKSTRCEKIGYRLIHIWEDEWREKKNEIKEKLKLLFEDKLIAEKGIKLSRDWFPLTENAIFYTPELLENGCWNSGFVEYY